jgi:hypothetical protein
MLYSSLFTFASQSIFASPILGMGMYLFDIRATARALCRDSADFVLVCVGSKLISMTLCCMTLEHDEATRNLRSASAPSIQQPTRPLCQYRHLRQQMVRAVVEMVSVLMFSILAFVVLVCDGFALRASLPHGI